jgi:hypothetical protein
MSDREWWLAVGESVKSAMNVGAYDKGCLNMHSTRESDGEMGKQ